LGVLNYQKQVKKKNAFILLEFIVGLSIIAVLFPLFIRLVLTEIKDNQKYLVESENSQQIVFAQNYLQLIANDASDIKVIGDTLLITASTKLYIVGLKNKELYVKQTAYRYLTTSPLSIDRMTIEEINDKLFKLKLTISNKIAEILIIRKIK